MPVSGVVCRVTTLWGLLWGSEAWGCREGMWVGPHKGTVLWITKAGEGDETNVEKDPYILSPG